MRRLSKEDRGSKKRGSSKADKLREKSIKEAAIIKAAKIETEAAKAAKDHENKGRAAAEMAIRMSKKAARLKNESIDLNDEIMAEINANNKALVVGSAAKQVQAESQAQAEGATIKDEVLKMIPDVKIKVKSKFKLEASHIVGGILILGAGWFMYKKYAK